MRSRRGFSLIEMLIALAICATLLTAVFTALDTSFKSYKVTTEGASTNVIARMVVHRVMSMIRTGWEFGPYPDDVLDSTQNPMTSTALEFTTLDDPTTLKKQIIRIERRDATVPTQGPYELWYVQVDLTNNIQTSRVERPLLVGVTEARFTLEYDVGPRLKRATVDLTVKPNDFQDAAMHVNFETPTIRLVSSVSPRRFEDTATPP